MPRRRIGYRIWARSDRCDADWDLRQARNRIRRRRERIAELTAELATATGEWKASADHLLNLYARALANDLATEQELLAELDRIFPPRNVGAQGATA